MIIIIGAGISGLTLARYLLNHEIPFRIFDQSLEERPQGFGLTLQEVAIPKLLDLLGIDEISLRKAVAVDRKTGSYPAYAMNVVTGERYSVGPFRAAYSKDFRCNRERLRSVIRGDVKVEYGCKLVSFKAHGDGVTAEFANGRRADGKLLVAADGVNSFGRTLLPALVPKDWPAAFFNGVCRMSIHEFDRDIRPVMGDWCLQLGLGDNLLIAVTLYDVDRDAGHVDLSWGYSRRNRGQDDPLLAPYGSKHDKHHAPPQLWEELAQLPHPLIKPFRDVFGSPHISKHQTIHQQLVSLLIPQDDLFHVLRTHKTVFVGDAVHDWTNHAGSAANAAIIDAITLGEVIADGASVESYYEQRRPSWQTSYDHNAQDFEALHRPQEEWNRLLEMQRREEQAQPRDDKL